MPDTDRMQDRLDEVEEKIDRARHDAEEHDLIEDTTPERTFIEPEGDAPEREPELDDPTIAPG
jgi:hypothetical protein